MEKINFSKYQSKVGFNVGSCLSDSLAVVVEDSSSSCCVTVKVFPHATIAALKQQVSLTVPQFSAKFPPFLSASFTQSTLVSVL